MNSNYNIVDYEKGDKVNYYTLISQEDDAITEADDFFIRMESTGEHSDELERFVEWMFIVADDLGVTGDTFRGERACFALPPTKKVIGESIYFRLYCHILSNNVVVLFNGDRKTEGARTPEECPRVYPHFIRGQLWAKKLMKAGIECDINGIIGAEFYII